MFSNWRMILLALLFFAGQYVEADGIFKMTKIEGISLDKSFVTIRKCRLQSINGNSSEFSLDLFLHKQVVTSIIHVQLLRKFGAYRTFLINLKYDGCGFFENRKKYPYIEIIYGVFERNTNLNHTCPYEGTVFVEKLTIDDATFVVPLPTAEYLLLADFTFNGKLALKGKLYFHFVRVNKKKRKMPKDE